MKEHAIRFMRWALVRAGFWLALCALVACTGPVGPSGPAGESCAVPAAVPDPAPATSSAPSPPTSVHGVAASPSPNAGEWYLRTKASLWGAPPYASGPRDDIGAHALCDAGDPAVAVACHSDAPMSPVVVEGDGYWSPAADLHGGFCQGYVTAAGDGQIHGLYLEVMCQRVKP